MIVDHDFDTAVGEGRGVVTEQPGPAAKMQFVNPHTEVLCAEREERFEFLAEDCRDLFWRGRVMQRTGRSLRDFVEQVFVVSVAKPAPVSAARWSCASKSGNDFRPSKHFSESPIQ